MNFDNPIEAFAKGETIPLPSKTVTKEEIIEFATEFDPIYFHLDEEAAKASLLGGLSASGFHTCAIVMRMVCDAYLLKSTSQGSPEVEEVKWLYPVRPNDTLSGHTIVLDGRRSSSKPNLWISKIRHDISNQNGIPVTSMTVIGIFAIPQGVA